MVLVEQRQWFRAIAGDVYGASRLAQKVREHVWQMFVVIND